MRKIFSTEHPLTDEDLVGFWQVVNRNFGNRIYHRLIHYMGDRKRFASRWGTALQNANVPLTFMWGMQDPVSGHHVIQYLKSQLPKASYYEWPDVGHYPQTEVPERVTAAILEAFRHLHG